MHKKILLFISSLLIYDTASAGFWSDIHPSWILGTGNTTVGSAQQLWLNTSPYAGLENQYSSGGKHHDTYFMGFGVEKTFKTHWNHVETAIGLEADYLKKNDMSGTINPMINVAPNFDTLSYSYDLNSYLLFATAKLSVLDIMPNLGGYLQAGVGGAKNELTDYTETTVPSSSAAPMLRPFGDNTDRQFAYSIAAGIICEVGKSSRLLIGYRYINTGLGSFSTSPVQETNNTLGFSPITHHFLTFTLTV